MENFKEIALENTLAYYKEIGYDKKETKPKT